MNEEDQNRILGTLNSIPAFNVRARSRYILGVYSEKIETDFLRAMLRQLYTGDEEESRTNIKLFLDIIKEEYSFTASPSAITRIYNREKQEMEYKSLKIYMAGIEVLVYNFRRDDDFPSFLRDYKSLIILTEQSCRDHITIPELAYELWMQDVKEHQAKIRPPVIARCLYNFLDYIIGEHNFFKNSSPDGMYNVLSVIEDSKIKDTNFNLLLGSNFIYDTDIILEDAYHYGSKLDMISNRLGIPRRNHYLDRIFDLHNIALYVLHFSKIYKKDSEYLSIVDSVLEWILINQSQFISTSIFFTDGNGNPAPITLEYLSVDYVFGMIYYICRFNLMSLPEEYETFLDSLETVCLNAVKTYMLVMCNFLQSFSKFQEIMNLLEIRGVLTRNQIRELSGDEFEGLFSFRNSVVHIENHAEQSEYLAMSDESFILHYAYRIEVLYSFIELYPHLKDKLLVQEYLDKFVESVSSSDWLDGHERPEIADVFSEEV